MFLKLNHGSSHVQKLTIVKWSKIKAFIYKKHMYIKKMDP